MSDCDRELSDCECVSDCVSDCESDCEARQREEAGTWWLFVDGWIGGWVGGWVVV